MTRRSPLTTSRPSPKTVSQPANVLTNDSDIEGIALSVTQFTVAGVAGSFTAGTTANIAGVGALVINADGSYTFTPILNYNGAVPVATYTATDGGLTSTATLTINVTPVNDALVGVNDSATTLEDTPVSVMCSPTTRMSMDLPRPSRQFIVGGTTFVAGSTASLAGVEHSSSMPMVRTPSPGGQLRRRCALPRLTR